jgi:hypothetical protein
LRLLQARLASLAPLPLPPQVFKRVIIGGYFFVIALATWVIWFRFGGLAYQSISTFLLLLLVRIGGCCIVR